MPWTTPTLAEVRGLVRDSIQAKLPGADALIPNSVLRVLSDNQGALCHAVLQYIDWLSLQLLPDTSETEWLDRHGTIWLKNADGTTGRKMATLATGTGLFTGVNGTTVPANTQLVGGGIGYETTDSFIVGADQTPGAIRALDPGVAGNQPAGSFLNLSVGVPNIDSAVEVVELSGGVDTENDNDLRYRILKRIQQPPMGGDADDFVNWALSVPGVTRAWCYPLELGIGTVTVRFMCDDLRAEFNGFPLPIDVQNVAAYIDTVRPVAVKDCFVEAPLPMPINLTIRQLSNDTADVRAAIELSIQNMLTQKAIPGGTVYRSWIEVAIQDAIGDGTYELDFTTTPMPAPGYLGTLGTILYAG